MRGKANIRVQQPEKAATCFARATTHSQSPSPELYRLQVLSTLAIDESHWQSAAQLADNGVERFGIEVNLLGLAIDIALAIDQPEKASHYLAKLPQALNRLPSWAERRELANCYVEQPAENRRTCKLQASRSLQKQVSEFMQ